MADRDITKDVLRMFNYGLYVATVQALMGHAPQRSVG